MSLPLCLSRGEIREDCAKLGDDVPSDPTARRKYFGEAETLERYWFEPGFMYTFNNYQARPDGRTTTVGFGVFSRRASRVPRGLAPAARSGFCDRVFRLRRRGPVSATGPSGS